MNLMEIILSLVGLILIFWSGAIGHLISPGRATPRALGPGPKALALPKVNITWLDVIYGIAMIVGILAKEIWDNINDTGTLNIKVPRLIAALIVSPIIYAAVYSKFVALYSFVWVADSLFGILPPTRRHGEEDAICPSMSCLAGPWGWRPPGP